jgi:hypothetical protein
MRRLCNVDYFDRFLHLSLNILARLNLSKARFGSVPLLYLWTLRLYNDYIVITICCLFDYQHFLFSCTIVLARMVLAHSFPC